MATAGSKPASCRIVEERTLTLKTEAGSTVNFTGIVVIDDMLIVTDDIALNLQIYNRHDGKFLSTSDRLESKPWDVCILSKTEVAVCLDNGKIVILSLKSIDKIKLVKTLNVRTKIDLCHSVLKWNSEKLIVSGWKFKNGDYIVRFVFVSATNGCMDSTHDVCKVFGFTRTAITNNTLYISCWNPGNSSTTGVYVFNMFKPRKPKVFYQHKNLTRPWPIIADVDFVYVCDAVSNSIHRLTHKGQLVTQHTMSSDICEIFYDDQHGVLCTTSYKSNVITIYRMMDTHQSEILKMDERSIQLFEKALEDGKETVYSICIMIVGQKDVGKTTLFKRLLGEKVIISERCSTEGIDVHVNCCDVSLLTHEWTRRPKDTELDYKLQRLVNLLNENYIRRRKVVNSELVAISDQMERTDGNFTSHVADGKNTEILYHRTQEQNLGKKLSSTSSLQRESTSTLVQSNVTETETNAMSKSELGVNVTIDNYMRNPLKEMFELLHQNPDKAKQDTRYAHLTMLDFAGQYAYYTTHQIFLRRNAIYLLVLDASINVHEIIEDDFYLETWGTHRCTTLDLVELWMNSIHSCAPSDKDSLNSANSNISSFTVIPPPVILVGTHIDQIPQNRQRFVGKVEHGIHNVPPEWEQKLHCRKHAKKYFKKIRYYLRDKPAAVHLIDKDFAIDNTVIDSKLEKLKKKIVEVASQQPFWGEQIPTRWFLLEQQLMKLKDTGVKVIERSEVEKLNKKGTVQIKESDELELFLKYLHETGAIIYFSIEVLRDNIVLDPMWLIDALKSLINSQPNLPINPAASAAHTDITQKWSNFKEKGILIFDLIDAIWTKESHPDLHVHKIHMLSLMEQLDIIARPRSFNEDGEKVEDYFLIPCMLRQESPQEIIHPEQDSNKVTKELCFIFKEKYLPTPIFHRLLAACVSRWPVAKTETSESLIFCGCCVFDLDIFHRLTVYNKSHIVYAKVTRPVIDGIRTLDAKLCSSVQHFITQNLNKITSYLGQNLQFKVPPSFEIWSADKASYLLLTSVCLH